MADPRVVFTPSGLSGSVPKGTTVLEAARSIGADLDTVCGGRGICGRCQVEPSVGSFAKWDIVASPDNLSPWGPLESAYEGKRPIEPLHRLGCSAQIRADVVIDIPPQSQIHKQVIRKALDLGDLKIDPVYTLHYIADGDPVDVLTNEWGFDLQGEHVSVPDSDTTVAVRAGATIAAAWPGYVDRIGGIAFDIGSTTIAGHLVD
ncbi:MAG: 2Fe-2S iron-sulfur cluster-binding protein, partial [Acidimicrobiales bacterium]